jgi:hypothetical protein
MMIMSRSAGCRPSLELPLAIVHCTLVILILHIIVLNMLCAAIETSALILTVFGMTIVRSRQTFINVVARVPFELPAGRA